MDADKIFVEEENSSYFYRIGQVHCAFLVVL